MLQEQEERLKKELEELSTVPEHERKPIPSDTQDVLQEMEELRTQFHQVNTQHEKAIADLKADHERQLNEMKESHGALMLSLTTDKDAAAEELKVNEALLCNSTMVKLFFHSSFQGTDSTCHGALLV